MYTSCSTTQFGTQDLSSFTAQNNFTDKTVHRSPRLCGLPTHAREGVLLLVMRAH